MLNYEEIKNLSADDVQILNALLPMTKKAQEIEDMIKSVYTFHIGEKAIEVFCNSMPIKKVVLTYNGVVKFDENAEKFEIKCDARTIFEYMRADFLRKNGFVKKHVVIGNSLMFEEDEDASVLMQNVDAKEDEEIIKMAIKYKFLLNFIEETDRRYKLATVEARR